LFLVVSTSVVDCLERLVSEMTGYVSSGTLNTTHSLTHTAGLTLISNPNPNQKLRSSETAGHVNHGCTTASHNCVLFTWPAVWLEKLLTMAIHMAGHALATGNTIYRI